VTWPSRQDYREALQACDVAFSDPELKNATAVCDNLGMPRAFSGQNATVFQLRNGPRTWAVKCFAHEFVDQQRRYAAVSTHLQKVRLPYTVAFQFLEQGVNVRGAWYPVLKMEWVEGEPLKRFIERSLRDPVALRQLAARFLEMVKSLQAVGVAHGDLQHGNLIVCGQGLRLVDYDGMFVPALAGDPSMELGHPSYQHPNRSAVHFSPALDNFSAWVIFLSLYGVSVTPDLWDSTGRMEECLLFRRKDFEAPYASQVIQRLAAAADPTLQQLVLRFQVLLYSSPEDASLPEIQTVPAATRTPSVPVGSWLEDHRRKAPAANQTSGPQQTTPNRTEPDPTWVVGWIKKPARPAAFRNAVTVERAAAVSSLILGSGLALFTASVDGYLTACLLSLFAGNLVLLKSRYEAEPDVGRLMQLSEEEKVLLRHIRIRMHSVQATEKERAGLERKTADDVGRLRNQETVLRAREVEEVNQLYAARDRRLQELATKRAKLDLEEAQELARVRKPIQTRLQALDQKLAALQTAEANELGAALRNLQSQHLLNYLQGSSIERATVSGVGPKLKERLMAAGFRTAADIEYYRVLRVQRIGPQLASGLVAWRKDTERAAAGVTPRALPQGVEATIRSRYAGQVQGVQTEKTREKDQLRKDEPAVRSKYATTRADFPRQEDQAKSAASTDVRDTQQRYVQRYREVEEQVQRTQAAGVQQVNEIQSRLAKLQKDLAGLRWKREILRLEKDQAASVTFSKYLRRVSWVLDLRG